MAAAAVRLSSSVKIASASAVIWEFAGSATSDRRRNQQAGFAVRDDFGCTAGAAGDDWFFGESGFDVDQSERFAVRWQAHDVDRLHQVGHVAAEAEQFESVGDSEFARRLFEFAAERAFAEAPELRFRQAIQNECGRLNQFAVAFLWRKMCERADDGRIEFSAQFAANIGTRARGPHVVRVDRVMHHGDSFGGNSLFDQVLSDGIGTRDEVALVAVPLGGREAVDVADRGWSATLLEPAAPPTGGGKMRVEQVGLEAAGGQGQLWDGQKICFSADAEAIERQVGGEQFEVGPTAACHKMADELIE